MTIAVTRSAGVTSNARFHAGPPASTSSSARSSIVIAAPSGVSISTVDSGQATTNGMPARAAASASG